MKTEEKKIADEPKVLITMAETADEAWSDFIGYANQYQLPLDNISFCAFEILSKELAAFAPVDIYNIISFDNEIPDDCNNWFAVDVDAGPNYEDWRAEENRC
jgi:hypothetical protein